MRTIKVEIEIDANTKECNRCEFHESTTSIISCGTCGSSGDLKLKGYCRLFKCKLRNVETRCQQCLDTEIKEGL